MAFDFNLYSTPLLFGFVQAWIYAMLFFRRAWRNERLSDLLFGGLLVGFSFEIWEYMLGFGGVEILWNELEFFPRTLSLLLPPLAWFYLKSQFNAAFRFKRKDIVHALPFLVYAIYHLTVFAMGRAFVQHWMQDVHLAFHLDKVQQLLIFIVQLVYFYQAFRLYRQYKAWAPTAFSDTETVDFRWFRNFLVAFFASNLIGWVMTLADLWLKLDFWHDWWDELFNAALIYYLCITGYSQAQPRKLLFQPTPIPLDAMASDATPTEPRQEKLTAEETQHLRGQIEQLMAVEKRYLEPELTLADLARSLQTNASVLSAAINKAFGKNFNDFVNEYRVADVQRLLQDPAVAHLSLLGMAMECGFNSKSTFNRAFRKVTGKAPSEWKASEG